MTYIGAPSPNGIALGSINPDQLDYNPYASRMLYVRDEKTDATPGGSSVAGVNQRDLNTVVINNISGASLGSNQITLPAGTYYIDATAPSYLSNRTCLDLYNVTDFGIQLPGSPTYSGATGATVVPDKVRGEFTITGTKVFRLNHYCETARVTFGLGVEVGSAFTGRNTNEIYTECRIWRIGD